MEPWTHGQGPGFIFMKFNVVCPGQVFRPVFGQGGEQGNQRAQPWVSWSSTVQWGCGGLSLPQVWCEMCRASQAGLQTPQCSREGVLQALAFPGSTAHSK